MALDAGPLAQLVAEFMDDLEEEYGADADLADAVIAVEVRHTEGDDEVLSTVEARSIGKRNTVAIGITTRALWAMEVCD